MRRPRWIGSSPHTRGAPDFDLEAIVDDRIIPAYAGSTSRRRRRRRTPSDHPRIRGEHPPFAARPSVFGGSSPHTRGARSVTPVALRPCRIIPAYAGSTVLDSGDHDDVGDHPRIRGEHTPTRTETSGASGSSPHTRGARAEPDGTTSSHRIIPAYAGSTNALAFTWGSVADHPRIRGEHDGNRPASQEREGSSPHTRGARPHLALLQPALRIIPAYAGSTQARFPDRRHSRDHPRIRGEHSTRPRLNRARGGSSPHTRGAHGPGRYGPDRRGIIPAYAGSTFDPTDRKTWCRDHPRIRGEHARNLMPPGG